MSEIKSISDAEFESTVVQADVPVLVDFWAEWCSPCKAVAPVLDEIAKEYDGRLKIVKVNIDNNADAAAKYGIRSIPSLLLFKEGNVAATKVGASTKSDLAAFIDDAI